MPVQIQEFQFDHNFWRLDWLGRFEYPSSFQSEPEILVYLSQLRADYIHVLANDALAEPLNHQVARIKVGQLRTHQAQELQPSRRTSFKSFRLPSSILLNHRQASIESKLTDRLSAHHILLPHDTKHLCQSTQIISASPRKR